MPLFKGTTPPSGGTFSDRIKKVGEHRPASGPTRAVEPHEKRLARDPVFVNATVVFGANSKLPVVVTNVNAKGARVEFVANFTLPGEVVLIAPILGLNRTSRIAWQKSGSAGLRFVDPPPAAPQL